MKGVGQEGSATAWQSVFNLGNCAIGAGILSFPYAFRLAGT
jgi:amino acid permease